jgi:hypothetical protein
MLRDALSSSAFAAWNPADASLAAAIRWLDKRARW